MGNHKKVVCEQCLRVMRSDVLKRHMKQHVEQAGKYVNETSGIGVGSSSTSLDKDYESLSEFSSVSTSYNASPINREVMIKTMEMNDMEYKTKMEKGKLIYETVKERNIAEESLCKEYKTFWNCL